MNRRLRTVKGFLWFVLGFAATVAVARFLGGLGAVTRLTDGTPWGLWVGFDVMGGVALAAGGFVIAALVYCLRQEALRPLLRPAVLTAFLGYVAVAVGLLFDLGRPWNIWRPMFFWQHHSVLFEVAWCVMLYTTVLALEFLPVPLEGSRFRGVLKALKSVTLPLVILGIMLSTLHQSSLGSLFLITPGRVHPLWYSPILPVLFFVSAVGLGLAMVTFESSATSWLYRRKPETALLRRLATPLGVALLVYGAIRIVDLAVRGQLGHVAEGWEGALFVFELLVDTIVPAALLLTGVAKRSGKGLVAVAAMVVFGFVFHRLNVGGVSGISMTDSRYFPSWQEIVTSLGVVSAAALVFLFFVERFRVYEPEEQPAEEPGRLPLWMSFQAPLATVRSSSLLFVVGAALSFGLLPDSAVFGARPEVTPVAGARRVLAERRDGGNPHGPTLVLIEDRELRDGAERVLMIDGNRDSRFALFRHDDHAARLGGEAACATCHHMNRPNDLQTSCFECHRDQYLPTDLFDHAGHITSTGGNSGCSQCHTDPDEPKTRRHTTRCVECHRDMPASGELVPAPADDSPFLAPAYMNAMHGTCLECHKREDAAAGTKIPRLALCGTCHGAPVDLSPMRTGKEKP